MKECSICKCIKPLNEFYSKKRISKKKGEYVYYHPECKECTIFRSTKWGDDNRDDKLEHRKKHNKTPYAIQKMREAAKRQREEGYTKEYFNTHPEKQATYNKNRASKNHKITQKEWDDCRLYFNYRCAYCDMPYEEQYKKFKKDLNREHVDDAGADDLSNCIPSCTSCNSQKWVFELGEWYTIENPVFCQERLNKILLWLGRDYKKYIQPKNNKNT